MVGAIQTLLELDRLGVATISLREPCATPPGPVRSLLRRDLRWVAAQKRERLREAEVKSRSLCKSYSA